MRFPVAEQTKMATFKKFSSPNLSLENVVKNMIKYFNIWTIFEKMNQSWDECLARENEHQKQDICRAYHVSTKKNAIFKKFSSPNLWPENFNKNTKKYFNI